MMTAAALPGHAAEVTIDGGRAPLHGDLTLPAAEGPVPAVLMIAGSGPTDRDGNTLPVSTPNTLRLLAEALGEQGIASLRFDKRGVGASAAAAGEQAETGFDVFVEDAVAWARFLEEQQGVGCVFLLGHSEGALIAALAAAEVDTCGVISIAGAGRPIGDVLRDQLTGLNAAGALPEPLFGQAMAILARLERGERVAEVPPELASLFHPVLQTFLLSWMEKDPAAAVAAIDAPVLVLQGTTDLQVGTADAELLAAANPRARLELLEGVNHVLKLAPPDQAANLATYADPNLSLAPGVAEMIAGFVQENAAE